MARLNQCTNTAKRTTQLRKKRARSPAPRKSRTSVKRLWFLWGARGASTATWRCTRPRVSARVFFLTVAQFCCFLEALLPIKKNRVFSAIDDDDDLQSPSITRCETKGEGSKQKTRSGLLRIGIHAVDGVDTASWWGVTPRIFVRVSVDNRVVHSLAYRGSSLFHTTSRTDF
jgi:hypothetical protein